MDRWLNRIQYSTQILGHKGMHSSSCYNNSQRTQVKEGLSGGVFGGGRRWRASTGGSRGRRARQAGVTVASTRLRVSQTRSPCANGCDSSRQRPRQASRPRACPTWSHVRSLSHGRGRVGATLACDTRCRCCAATGRSLPPTCQGAQATSAEIAGGCFRAASERGVSAGGA